jgi:predicted GNAT family acetyltransferase
VQSDEPIYEAVAFELEHEGPRKGLWVKAFAKAGGVAPVAKALYIEWRVEQLTEDLAAELARAEAHARKQADFEAETARLRTEAEQESARLRAETEYAEKVSARYPEFVRLARRFCALGLSVDLVKMQLQSRGLAEHLVEQAIREVSERA